MRRLGASHVRRGCPTGFSLVELLVVVSIIGLLVGLAATAIPKALDAGDKAKAKGDLTAIVAAVKAYKQEYGQWPAAEGIGSSPSQEFGAWYGPSKWAKGDGKTAGKELMMVLSGKNRDQNSGSIWDRPMNPKEIRFLEGPDGQGNFKDPWGTQYCVKMDVNESGGMEYGTGSGGAENLRLTVIAVSLGKNMTQEDTPDVKGFDDIYSWGKNLSQ